MHGKLVCTTLLVLGMLAANCGTSKKSRRTPADDNNETPKTEQVPDDQKPADDKPTDEKPTDKNDKPAEEKTADDKPAPVALTQADCDKTNQVLSSDGRSCVDPIRKPPLIVPGPILNPIIPVPLPARPANPANQAECDPSGTIFDSGKCIDYAPETNYRNDSGSIFYVGGSKHYCTYKTLGVYKEGFNSPKTIQVSTLAMPAGYTDDGACNLHNGVYRLTDGTIFKVTSPTAYCVYENLNQYKKDNSPPFKQLDIANRADYDAMFKDQLSQGSCVQ